MTPTDSREVWLRGPLTDTPPLVQPVAHALMQAREEVTAMMLDFPGELLWVRPVSSRGSTRVLASVGFHLQHLTGVLDRLFTYAKGQSLSPAQLVALSQEGDGSVESVAGLVRRFGEQVEQSLAYLRTIDEQTLTEPRGVGKAQLPSTVLGLLTHAAEHTMRHVGQLLVTAQWVTINNK